jgi:hypothetical protein
MKLRYAFILTAGILAGCGEKQVSSPQELKEAFAKPAALADGKTTSPEVKNLVDQAVNALQKKDEVTAVMSLETLRSNPSQLTADQLVAVQDMMAKAQSRLAERAAAGDPQARAALEAMKFKHR